MTSSMVERPTVGTAIRSVDEMAALPVGTRLGFRQGSHVEHWARIESGWVCTHRNGTDLTVNENTRGVAERFFVGMMADGRLTVLADQERQFAVGMVLASGRYDYIVFEVEDGEYAKVVCFRGDELIGPDRVHLGFLNRDNVTVVERAGSERVVALMAWSARTQDSLTQRHQRQVQEQERQRVRVAEMLETTRRERDEALRQVQSSITNVPSDLVASLHTYASEVDDQQFDDLLDRHHISRAQTVTVTVTVTGYSYVTLSMEQAAANMDYPSRYLTDVEDSSRVSWRREFTVTRVTPPGTCACDDVSEEDDDVRENCPAEYESFEIDECHCEND